VAVEAGGAAVGGMAVIARIVVVKVEVEVTLQLTVSQSVSMSWYRVPL
jgi:hypothetical protein